MCDRFANAPKRDRYSGLFSFNHPLAAWNVKYHNHFERRQWFKKYLHRSLLDCLTKTMVVFTLKYSLYCCCEARCSHSGVVEVVTLRLLVDGGRRFELWRWGSTFLENAGNTQQKAQNFRDLISLFFASISREILVPTPIYLTTTYVFLNRREIKP